MFRDDFVWGVAGSAYQIEGTEPGDGHGLSVWDRFVEDGRVFEGQNAEVACDHMHRYREDFALMGSLGIRAYRFSVNWARIMPDGTGRVNEKAIAMYRDMIKCMKANGVTPYLTLFHWEYPLALYYRGGWLNRDSVEWFGEYARVIAENFGDIVDNFITMNEPQCHIGLGLASGEHAPGIKMAPKETFLAAHHILMAHGQAVINLRKYAGRPIKVGYAPTCGVPYPLTDSPEDVAAAKEAYFGLSDSDMDHWAWNVSWFSDPVFLGHYPEEGLKKFAKYLPEFADVDMALINQHLDFMGENIYNGYPVRAGADGRPEPLGNPAGTTLTASHWPVTPCVLYYASKFLTERYPNVPLYITENGMACHDMVSADGQVHDPNRISFIDEYLGQLQRAADEGADVRGYFVWTFLDDFEWPEGYSQRFGFIYVDYATQRRTVKDSAYWYKKVIETNGGCLSVNNPARDIIFLDPVCTHNIWGGKRLREEFGCKIDGDDIGECWGISAHPNGDATVKDGRYAGMKLSEVWQAHPELFGNPAGGEFPLLTKIIDAKDDLSIQVHPDDSYAAEHENGAMGKTECWYVLDCPESGTLVVGHNAESKAQLTDMVNGGKWDEFIREVPIRKGDFIQIDPGTVHAIKGGVLLLETQQNSDVTYRVYDYGRLWNGKPRELHLKKALDVIKVPADAASSVRHTDGLPKNELNVLYSCKYYTVFLLDLDGEISFEQKYPFLNASVVEGCGIANSRAVRQGEHFIFPGGFGEVRLQGRMKLVFSTVESA
ncbi:MAG: beta-glucosidase [Clostridiales bacterium]|nr:beta-glucosidase [Clostridiales bacterium]